MDKKTARKVDKGGRITIPKNIREKYNIQEGQAAECKVEEFDNHYEVCFMFQYNEESLAYLERIVNNLTQQEKNEAISRGNT